LIHAIASEISATDVLPNDIQWMPPGEHEGVGSRGGKPHKFKFKIDSTQAARVQRDFLAIKAKADAGQEDRPYFDLNHDDREASAHPTEYFWGGDNPASGGIRAKVKWSGAGENAIKGKTYRRFSPTFFLNAGGEVSLIHPSGDMAVNQGGLVNRAAFKRIAPIWSKSADADQDPAAQPTKTKTEDETMKSLLSVLAAQGLLKSADVDEGTAVTQVTAALTERAQAVSAKESELTTLKAKAADVEKKYNDLVDAHATSVVDAAITAGRLPGQNAELKAKWVGLIKADPTNASLLPDPNPALATVIAKGKGAGDAANAAAKDGVHPFMAKVAEYQASHKSTEAFAIEAVGSTKEGNKLYNEYRESLYKMPVAA